MASLDVKHHGLMDYENLSPGLRDMKFGVAGAVYEAAVKRIKEGKKVIFTNIGNPHQLGQQPLTFMRQVLALVTAPFLLEDPIAVSRFPSDAVARAREYLTSAKGGVGAYSDSRGHPIVLQEVAEFLERRDGVAGIPGNIFLTNGASEGVRMCLRALLNDTGGNRGVLTPIPQYPLYTASVSLYGGKVCGYYLDESSGWTLSITELQRALDQARSNGIEVVALVFINPGNPTGQCLTEQNLRDLVCFCLREKLVLLADEVYQENVYITRPFKSVRKVLHEMGSPHSEALELVNFHTVSKGAWGECGLRGGYFELMNIDPRTNKELFKLASVNLAPNAPGQFAMGLMVNPPKVGDVSYANFVFERDSRIASLQRAARAITDGFNACEGVTCQEVEGAMYSFPQITLPARAVAEAERRCMSPDTLYCLELLEATGISTTPGSGFGQAPGTFHIRTTILPPEEVVIQMMEDYKVFHASFIRKYGGLQSRL